MALPEGWKGNTLSFYNWGSGTRLTINPEMSLQVKTYLEERVGHLTWAEVVKFMDRCELFLRTIPAATDCINDPPYIIAPRNLCLMGRTAGDSIIITSWPIHDNLMCFVDLIGN
jgi:hypothetical protein